MAFKSLSACSLPASGPESKSTVARQFSRMDPWGTRTEAGQNVPQEKPDVIASRIVPVVERSVTWAVVK